MSLGPFSAGSQVLNWYCSEYPADFPASEIPYRYHRWWGLGPMAHSDYLPLSRANKHGENILIRGFLSFLA